jgi:4-amino-4-deoxychorismate lyase
MRIGPVLVDGVPVDDGAIPVDDIAAQRGYGCFETIRSYAGTPFRLDRHLARLRSSAERLGMTLPDEADLARCVEERAAEGDCSVRVIVTGGTDLDHPGTGSRTLVFAEELASPPSGLRLLPVVAPWHADGAWSGLTGAKSLSYAPNMEARLAAVRSGFDDALLIGRSGSVLEGPNSSIAWVRGDRLEYPDGSLGVLDSITLGAVVELAPEVGLGPTPGRYPLDRLLGAAEVVSLSTIRQVMPVVSVGDRPFDAGPRTTELQEAFADLVAGERRTAGAV